MKTERRDQPRYELALPIEIGTTRGVTRNLSTDAVLFVSPQPFEIGATVRFIVRVGGESGLSTRLACTGEVTRVERQPDGTHATAAILSDMQVLSEPPGERV
jgi:hypothetical protein